MNDMYAHRDIAPSAQVARFSGVAACASVRQALAERGLLPLDETPVLAELAYPFNGASWTIGELPSRLVLCVSLRETAEGFWLLKIQARPPVRPTVIRRRALQLDELHQAARRCFEVAVELHRFLSTTYVDLAWAVDRDPGDGGGSDEPTEPSASSREAER